MTRASYPRGLLLAVLPLMAIALFLRNNPLPEALVHLGARLGSGLALIIVVLHGAHTLATRRPPWRWARSLPSSSTRRVLTDALCLGASAAPVVAILPGLAPGALLAGAAILPYLAVRSADSVRTMPRLDVFSAHFLIAELMIVVGLVALWSWTTLAALLATGPAFALAARRDRELRVSAWLPKSYLGDGDPEALRHG